MKISAAVYALTIVALIVLLLVLLAFLVVLARSLTEGAVLAFRVPSRRLA